MFLPKLPEEGLWLGSGWEGGVLDDSSQDVFPESKKARAKNTGFSFPHTA